MPVAVKRPLAPKHEMEARLAELGYWSDDRKRFDRECERDTSESKRKNPPRLTYYKGSFRVLTESHDRPYWTVQKKMGAHILWYVDFPLDVGVETVLKFIECA